MISSTSYHLRYLFRIRCAVLIWGCWCTHEHLRQHTLSRKHHCTHNL